MNDVCIFGVSSIEAITSEVCFIISDFYKNEFHYYLVISTKFKQNVEIMKPCKISSFWKSCN